MDLGVMIKSVYAKLLTAQNKEKWEKKLRGGLKKQIKGLKINRDRHCSLEDKSKDRWSLLSIVSAGQPSGGQAAFQIPMHALYSTRPWGLVQAIFWHTCPDLDLGPWYGLTH